jgi:hypothetical protein
MRYRLQYGRLDDFGEVIQWLDYPPATGRYITRRARYLQSKLTE